MCFYFETSDDQPQLNEFCFVTPDDPHLAGICAARRRDWPRLATDAPPRPVKEGGQAAGLRSRRSASVAGPTAR